MTPREFLSRYGQAVPRTHTLDVGQSLVIPANPDRAVFVLWSASNAVAIVPGEGTLAGHIQLVFPVASLPLILSHHDVGAFVSGAFTLTVPVGPTSFTYIEVSMPGTSITSGVPNNGKAKLQAQPNDRDWSNSRRRGGERSSGGRDSNGVR